MSRNQLQSHDGAVFDFRNITSPIIVFTSEGDNISPPQQTLGWILDLYRDADDIRAAGRTIIYCLNQKVGHLALFVSSKVGAKEDEEFVQLIDVIDCLPPGLFEMVIESRPADTAIGGFVSGDWISRFETRTLDDIRALGRNSPADDRAFAAVKRLSELNHLLYATTMQPLVRALANRPAADFFKAMNPLRLGYAMFAGTNPWMKGVQQLATQVEAEREPAAPGNPFLTLQKAMSDRIVAGLDTYRGVRDQWAELMFFGFYGSSVVQGMLGINDRTSVRELPGITPEQLATRRAQAVAYASKIDTGGYDEALTRSVLYVISGDGIFDQRCALALNNARAKLMGLSLDEFKALVREQFYVLLIEPERSVAAIASLVPDVEGGDELLKQVRAIVGAGGAPAPAESDRIAQLTQVLHRPRAAELQTA